MIRVSAAMLVLMVACLAGCGPVISDDIEDHSAAASTTALRVEDGLPGMVRVTGDAVQRGVVPVGSTVVRRVEVVNVSGVAVELKAVRQTCACVGSSLGREPVTLKPGEGLAVTVEAAVDVPVADATHALVLAARPTVDEGSPGRAVSETAWREFPLRINYSTGLPYRLEPTVVYMQGLAGEYVERHLYFERVGERAIGIERVALSPDVSFVDAAMVGPVAGSDVERVRLSAHPEFTAFPSEGVVSILLPQSEHPLSQVRLVVATVPATVATPPAALFPAGLDELSVMIAVRPEAVLLDVRDLAARVVGIDDEDAPWLGSALRIEMVAPEHNAEQRRLIVRMDRGTAPTLTGAARIVLIDRSRGIAVGDVPVAWFGEPAL